jgi:hypothetical protein
VSGKGHQEGLGEPRHVLEQGGEVPAADDEESDRGGGWAAIQQAHLAEELARVQARRRVGGNTSTRAVPSMSKKNFVPRFPSPREDGPRRDVKDPGDLRDAPKLAAATPLRRGGPLGCAQSCLHAGRPALR